MYLSPGVVPPTYYHRHRRHLALTRSGIAERRDAALCHSSCSARSLRRIPSAPVFLLPFALVQRPSHRPSVSFSHTSTQQRRVTPTHELTRSFHVPLRINSRLFLSSFFAFLLHPFLRLALLLPCVHRSLTHTNDVTAKPRRIVASRRVASVLRALTDFSISILFSRIRRNITARC